MFASKFTGLVEFSPSFQPRHGLTHVLFDFDGTLSLIRQGWPDVMVPMFTEVLPALPGETDEQRRQLAFEDIMRLNGIDAEWVEPKEVKDLCPIVNISDDIRWELLAPGLWTFKVPGYAYTKWTPQERPGRKGLSLVYSATERHTDADITNMLRDGHRVAVVLDVRPADLPDVWDVNLSGWENDSVSSRFSKENHQGEYVKFVKQVTRKPVVPSDEEIARNPRARSASLRVAEKIPS